jgi:hypothetical protein
MTEALLLVVVGSLVPISVATLIVAVLALRKAQLYVESVERRLESFHEGQILLLTLLRERDRSSEGEREQRAQGEELVQQERDRLALAVHTRRSAGQGIDGGPRPGLRDDEREAGIGAEARPPLARDPHGSPDEKPPGGEARGAETRPRPASFPDTTLAGSAEAQPEDEGARRAVWHPHPDDDVSPARAGGPGEAAVEMFRMHYDKYLDNYEGYVKLAARLYRMRDDAEVPPGTGAEREWEGRLRRVTDGIQRTTSRLDILEEYNPELATDDRISRRAAIARSQRELEIQRRQS